MNVVGLSGVLLACGASRNDGEPQTKPEPSAWERLVAAGADQKYSYSFSYLAAPPEGRTVRATAVSGLSDPCGIFRGEDPPENFDAFNLQVPLADFGTYEIAPHDDVKARFEVVSMANGKVTFSRFALSGTVTYEAGATSEGDWEEHRPGVFTVEATFEGDPVASSECEGSQNVVTGESMNKCTCRRQSGEVFVCEARGDSCCDSVPDSSATVLATYQVTASACPEQCSYAGPELSVYCAQLR